MEQLRTALSRSPVVSILGPRQCGKTTLARAHATSVARVTHFDLENPMDVVRLEAPMTTLERLRGLVVIDEVQRMPKLFEILRVLADRPRTPARFLILGSADASLVRGVSESLAGRVEHIDLGGFDALEVPTRIDRLWLRGGLPRSFLARTDAASAEWRRNYVRDFLQRDLAELGVTIPAATLGRFWTMMAHYHGGIWNAAEFARSLGTSENTARHYLDIMTGAWAIRQLQPWFVNTGKRLVRSPKVYVRDSGLMHTLLDIARDEQLRGHPKSGASWEGFVIEQILSVSRARGWFWATHQGAEIDLLLDWRGKRYGCEVKITDAPTMTKSIRIAQEDLGLERVFVVHPGHRSYAIDARTEAIGLLELLDRFEDGRLSPKSKR